MTGCMILQVCNMFKASPPAKIGLIDTPFKRTQHAAYIEALGGLSHLPLLEAQYIANKKASKVIFYPLNK